MTLSQVLSTPGLITRYVTTIRPSSILFSNCPCLKGTKWDTDNNADNNDIDCPADNSHISEALDEDLLNASSSEQDIGQDENVAPSDVFNLPFVLNITLLDTVEGYWCSRCQLTCRGPSVDFDSGRRGNHLRGMYCCICVPKPSSSPFIGLRHSIFVGGRGQC
jgi:hypothetical protein